MRIGDKVRVIFNEVPHVGVWFGDEGIIIDRWENENFKFKIINKVGTDPDPTLTQTWKPENLVIIDSIDEYTYKWLQFFGVV